MEITIRPAYQEKETIRALFAEYTDMLLARAPDFAGYLKQQNFERELADLEEKYGLPWGACTCSRWTERQPAALA